MHSTIIQGYDPYQVDPSSSHRRDDLPEKVLVQEAFFGSMLSYQVCHALHGPEIRRILQVCTYPCNIYNSDELFIIHEPSNWKYIYTVIQFVVAITKALSAYRQVGEWRTIPHRQEPPPNPYPAHDSLITNSV